MASANASNFSIDHILGFVSNGKSASTSTANAHVSSWTDSVGDLCPRPETYCNSNPVSQRTVPPHPYLLETPYHSMQYDYFGYASFNYYPLGFGQRSFQNGAGPQSQYVYLPVDNLRKRNRMRTVFTENQTQKLEHLFGVTDYPAAEAREELAVKAGLSAETVRA
ncbi:dharma [Conger conger]|uniref:dharma n=1 Tax=Conger conger TaxID=82655 RepID=UPI002A5A38E1|nr:dharma [Conger conger]